MSPVKIRVEYYRDPESQNWGFRVPALRLVGGGCDTREEAETHALDAIRYALADDDGGSGEGGVESGYVEVTPVLAKSA